MARESGGRGGSKALRREQDSRDKGIEELQRKNAKLIDDLARTNRDLVRTTRDRDRWKRRSEHLKKQLAAARRAGRRQAAPFAKDRPQGRSGRPGRRPGARYGRQGCRRRPAGVDETHAAPTPRACPDCGGAVEVTRVASQYQEELPKVRPIVRRFDIEVGRCSQCRRRVQGRHRLQTSDALGAAAVQLGPGLASLVVELHTEMGVPLAKVVGLLRTRLGVQVTTGGLARLLHRAARNAMPVYRELCSQVRNAPVVTPDETGWRVGAIPHWLWAYVTPETTVYVRAATARQSSGARQGPVHGRGVEASHLRRDAARRRIGPEPIEAGGHPPGVDQLLRLLGPSTSSRFGSSAFAPSNRSTARRNRSVEVIGDSRSGGRPARPTRTPPSQGAG